MQCGTSRYDSLGDVWRSGTLRCWLLRQGANSFDMRAPSVKNWYGARKIVPFSYPEIEPVGATNSVHTAHARQKLMMAPEAEHAAWPLGAAARMSLPLRQQS